MPPLAPEEWKQIEERFTNRWNGAVAVGAIAGKHVTMKKPTRSGSEYYTTQVFSMVLLALGG